MRRGDADRHLDVERDRECGPDREIVADPADPLKFGPQLRQQGVVLDRRPERVDADPHLVPAAVPPRHGRGPLDRRVAGGDGGVVLGRDRSGEVGGDGVGREEPASASGSGAVPPVACKGFRALSVSPLMGVA